MSRVNVVLLVALVLSSLWLVQTAYQARSLFAQIDRAKNESLALEVDFKRLEAERQAQATHLRVEKVARERLAMRTATPAVTQYIGIVVPAAASGAAP